MARKEGYRWRRGAWQPTDRQREVLDLLAEGKTNAEIAVLLSITVDGAKWHVGELLAEVGCADRQVLASWWRGESQKSQGRWLLAPVLLRRIFGFGLAAVAAIAFVTVLAVVAFGRGVDERIAVDESPREDSPPDSEVPVLDTAPDWSLAHFYSREGQRLIVRLDATAELVRIDLPQLAVFDCRVDCYYTDGNLGPIGDMDELCIGWLDMREGQQSGKLWVNRYTCEEGGRVIPP